MTNRSAALWTDNRYDTQADQQMDCQWSLIMIGGWRLSNEYNSGFDEICMIVFIRGAMAGNREPIPDVVFLTIGLYRDVWIAAIASSTTSLATRMAAICVRFQGRRVRRVYVTMQITFLARKSALIYRRGLRQRVASLTLNCNGDFAIRAY